MEDNKIIELDLNDILPNRFQPRIKFNEDSIIELSESIKEHGVLQPIIVRPIGDKYEIVAGERRYKAAVLAGLDTIPSRVIALDDKNSAEIALIENVQRKDLTPIEEAISYKKILDMGYITQEQLAAKLGRSQSTIANKIRLLNLCDEVQEALMEEKISERHARSLLKLDNFDDQRYLLKRIVKERLTVRKTDEEISKLLVGEREDEPAEVMTEPTTPESEIINPGFVDVDKIKETAEDINIDDTIIDISSLFEDDDLDDIHVEEPKSLKKNDVIDTSMFSKFINPEIDNTSKSADIPVPKEETSISELVADIPAPVTEVSTPIPVVEEQKVGEKKEEIGETNNMMNTEYNDIYNQKVGNPEDIVPVEHFGKFFDPSYFDDEEVNKVPGTPLLDLNNAAPSPSTIFNTEVEQTKPDLMAVQHPDGTLNSNPTPANVASLLEPTPSVDSVPVQPEPVAPVEAPVEQVQPIAVEQPQNQGQETMFPNLMNNENNKEFIDEQTFNQMLDPTYVDGEKQVAPANSDIIDVSVFSKFLDPDYDMKTGEYITDKNKAAPAAPAQETNTPTNDAGIIPTISFAQYMEGASQVAAPPISVEPVAPVEAPVEQVQPEPVTSTANNQTDVIPIDLLAPTMSEGNVSPAINPVDVNLTSGEDNMNNNSNDQVVSIQDLLAPMGAAPAQRPMAIEPQQMGTGLTPDMSFNQPKAEPLVEPKEEVIPVEETPVFVTASTPTQEVNMPSTPIIEDTSSSAILAPTPVEPEPVVEAPAPVPPAPINPAIGTMENQPIIVTDYNKQYDPIIPNAPVSTGPTIDLKQVIEMIRNLNDKIESYGFNIDTEENDLEGIYQVIFKIEKK